MQIFQRAGSGSYSYKTPSRENVGTLLGKAKRENEAKTVASCHTIQPPPQSNTFNMLQNLVWNPVKFLPL